MELVLANAIIFCMFSIGYVIYDYWKHWRNIWEKLEEIIGDYYKKATGEEKKEVYKYLQKYCNWL